MPCNPPFAQNRPRTRDGRVIGLRVKPKMRLVVRTLRQCAGGTVKKLSSSSPSRSRQATVRGRRGSNFCAQAL